MTQVAQTQCFKVFLYIISMNTLGNCETRGARS